MRILLGLLFFASTFIVFGYIFKVFMIAKCKENPYHEQYVCYMIPRDIYIVVCGDFQITSSSFVAVDFGHFFFSCAISAVVCLFWALFAFIRSTCRKSWSAIRSIRPRRLIQPNK